MTPPSPTSSSSRASPVASSSAERSGRAALPHARTSLVLHLLFFASGGLGLVYEVLWARRFTAVFGGTTLANTATLSGFFLGLALGSAFFGARAPSWRRPLLAFGFLEIGVGAGALLVRPIVGLYGHLYPSLYPVLSPMPVAFALVKLALAMAAVGAPAFCMGGTLPVLGQVVAPEGDRVGVRAGGLYAVNVLGATLGALSVPFVLLPRLGLERGHLFAVCGSVVVGASACLLALRRAGLGAAEGGSAAESRRAGPQRRVLGLAFFSGVATLALQVVWMRMFSFVHESSIHSFAVVVAVFLVGLAGGAALAREALRHGRAPRPLLAAAWLSAGALVFVSPRLFHHLTGGFAYLAGGSTRSALGSLLMLSAIVMLPATIALGMALPLLMEGAGASGRASGPALGRLLAGNTVGAILGPLLATFVVVPALGLWWSIVGIGLALIAAGAAGLASTRRVVVAAATLGAVLLIAPARLPPVRVTAGERVVSVREGSYGTTAVLADDRDRWITQNNSYVLGGAAAAADERFQAHLPLLLHESPRRVGFLGLGTGITAGAALAHPVESVVALEIVPEVVQAARRDFRDVNAGVVDDARVTVVADDGRNYLAAHPGRFDVVVGDLLVPWRPAEAPLYTRDHFASVRAALAPDGLFCQWVPLYQVSDEQLAILVRTFVDVFPGATLWRGSFVPDEATLALVGRTGTRPLDPEGIDRRLQALPPVVAAANPFLAHPAGLWLFFAGPVLPNAPGLSAARLNSDAEPWIELSSAGRGPTAYASAVGIPPLLDAASRAPITGTDMGELDQPHASWRNASAALARASLDRGPAGESAVRSIMLTLPAELRRALGVE